MPETFSDPICLLNDHWTWRNEPAGATTLESGGPMSPKTMSRFFVSVGVVLAVGCGGGGAPADTGAQDVVQPVDASSDVTTDTPVPMDVPVDVPSNPDTGPADTGTAPTCGPTAVTSTCGPAGVVRVAVQLGAGMANMTGTLVVNLNHYRLGSGATGGVPHTGTMQASFAASATMPGTIAFDMCVGGTMWSEDNCEFNLWGFLDRNGNGMLDAGEPAGRSVISISCHNNAVPCYSLTLDCMSGMSCAAFTDPGLCHCGTPACTGAGRIVTCM
jgi:hypothetical protein